MFFFPVPVCFVSTSLLLLSDAGLCECFWLLWAAGQPSSRSWRVPFVLCPVTLQSLSLSRSHEGHLPNWPATLPSTGQLGVLFSLLFSLYNIYHVHCWNSISQLFWEKSWVTDIWKFSCTPSCVAVVSLCVEHFSLPLFCIHACFMHDSYISVIAIVNVSIYDS